MTYDTINDDKTIAGNGEGTLLAGRYRIVRQLGQGGMGSVWLAEDTQLDDKPFAIKMLPSILVSNKRAYNQLKAEALVAMKLTHPNIVTLRAFEENNGNPFLVMDYIDGQTLDDYLAEHGSGVLTQRHGDTEAQSGRAGALRPPHGDDFGRVEHVERVEGNSGRGTRPACPSCGIPEADVLRILRPIAAALDYAHGKGVVHRDVKPGNVMIARDGTPYILDFGIAREIQETLTRVTGKLSSGTLLYMSPEQLMGEQPKPAQDIYSFAAMAYECLRGEPPFSHGQIEFQIMNKQPEHPPGGAQLVASVMSGLAKKPEERPPTCSALLEGNSLSRVEHVETVRVRVPRARTGGSRSRATVGIFAAAALALAAVGGWWWMSGREKAGGPRGATVTVGTIKTAGIAEINAVQVPVVPSVSDVPSSAPHRRETEEDYQNNVTERRLHGSAEEQPPTNFPGAVGTSFELTQRLEPNHVRPRDLVTATYTLTYDGFCPSNALPVVDHLSDMFKFYAIKEVSRSADKIIWTQILVPLTATATNSAQVSFRYYDSRMKRHAVAIARAKPLTFVKADAATTTLLPAPNSLTQARAEAAREAKAFFVNTALQLAQTYFDAEKWQDCIAEADKVLGCEADNEVAAKLKKDAESHLVPTMQVVAKIDGREISGAKVQAGDESFTTPFVWKLREGSRYGPYTVSYESGGKRYYGTIDSVTVDWRGPRVIPVVLEEHVGHPNSSKAPWKSLYDHDRKIEEQFDVEPGVWHSAGRRGEITADKDKVLWTKDEYENFAIDFEYKLEPGANSGMLIYGSDTKNWIPNTVEVQLLDDYAEKWSNDPAYMKNASLYGHCAPTKQTVRRASEWNRMTVFARGKNIQIICNGEKVLDADLSKWTDAKKNPDGTDIPPWFSRPWADLPTKGKIGFQGMHGKSRPYFRNIRIRPL